MCTCLTVGDMLICMLVQLHCDATFAMVSFAMLCCGIFRLTCVDAHIIYIYVFVYTFSTYIHTIYIYIHIYICVYIQTYMYLCMYIRGGGGATWALSTACVWNFPRDRTRHFFPRPFPEPLRGNKNCSALSQAQLFPVPFCHTKSQRCQRQNAHIC